jgi:hypothetical protein
MANRITKSKVEKIVNYLKNNEDEINGNKSIAKEKIIKHFDFKKSEFDLAEFIVNRVWGGSNSDNTYISIITEYYDEPTSYDIKDFIEEYSINDLVGKEIQYGEKTSIVNKTNKASFVFFENGENYPVEDLIMIGALVFTEDEIDEKITFEKDEDYNPSNSKYSNESLFTKIDHLIRKKYPYDEYETVNKIDGIAFMPIEEDIAIFLIEGPNIGINWSWGGLTGAKSKDNIYMNKIDIELSKQVKWSDEKIENILDSIVEVVKTKLYEQIKNMSIEDVILTINEELPKLKDEKYYGSKKQIEQENWILERLKDAGFNYEEDLSYQEYVLKATIEERYNYILNNIIPVLKGEEVIEEVVEEVNRFKSLMNSADEFIDKYRNDLIGKKVEFIDLMNDRNIINIEEILKVQHHSINDTQIPSVEIITSGEDNPGSEVSINNRFLLFPKRGDLDKFLNGEEIEYHYNEVNVKLLKEEPKMKYHVSWEKRNYDKDDEIVDIDFFSKDNGFRKEEIARFRKMKLGDIEHDEAMDVEVIAVPEDFELTLKQDEIVEEKPTENKMDQFSNMYYVVKNKKKILSGHQYKEDAVDEYSDRKEVGENLIEVMSRRDIDKLGLDLSDNSIWETDFHDWNIIKEAIDFGVTEGDYNEESAKMYFDGFKSNGQYSYVVKARLIYFLGHAQKHLKQAFLNSQIDKAVNFIEKCTSSEMELMRMLKAE